MTENTIARNKLCNILQTNADLPIMALVNADVVADDWYQTWFGDVTDAYIDNVWAGKEKIYFIGEALDNKNIFMSNEFPENALVPTSYMDDAAVDKWMMYAEEFIKGLPWKKVIVLTVNTPNSLHGDGEE